MTEAEKERAAVVAKVAALFCKAGNIRWSGFERCSMNGNCPLCLAQAEDFTSVSAHLKEQADG